MRRALTYMLVGILAGTAAIAAERRSWNKIHYVGGTIPIKTNPYDWNAKLTVHVNPNVIEIVISPAKLFAPQETIKLKASQVVSLSGGPAAWRHVAEVSGAQLPSKPPSLFGILQDDALLGVVYEADDGKRGAILLDSLFTWQMLPVLRRLTGKTIEDSP
jgi:hypothetical protein